MEPTVTEGVYEFFARPLVPLVSVILYLTLSGPVFSTLKTTFDIKPKGPFMQLITITHSALLAVYSLWTCVNTWRIAIPLIAQNGFFGTFCDQDDSVWVDAGMGWWITHFYISKYYEFIDTWIVLLKGREPMFLQTFHHAGVVLCMWAVVYSKDTAGGGIVTCLNSFIHTIMYTYYVFAALGVSFPLKHYITMAQMIQFVVGLTSIAPTHFIEGCVSRWQSLSTLGLQIFAVCLIYLFAQFYSKTYSKKST